MTVQIHDSEHKSFLDANSDKIDLRGMVNLLVLILMSYTLRAIVQSIEEYDIIILKEVIQDVIIFLD